MASNHDTTTAPYPQHHLRRHHRRSSSSLRRGALTHHNDGTATASTSGGGLVTTEVWFLDNSTRSYSLPRGATAGDLVKAIVERLGLRVGVGEEDWGAVTVEDLLPFFGLVESYTGKRLAHTQSIPITHNSPILPNLYAGATLDRPVNKAEPLAGLLDAHTSSSSSTTSSTDSGDSNHSNKLVFLLSAPGFPCLRQLSTHDPALLYHRSVPIPSKGSGTTRRPIDPITPTPTHDIATSKPSTPSSPASCRPSRPKTPPSSSASPACSCAPNSRAAHQTLPPPLPLPSWASVKRPLRGPWGIALSNTSPRRCWETGGHVGAGVLPLFCMYFCVKVIGGGV